MCLLSATCAETSRQPALLGDGWLVQIGPGDLRVHGRARQALRYAKARAINGLTTMYCTTMKALSISKKPETDDM